jgi:hypothetical protein
MRLWHNIHLVSMNVSIPAFTSGIFHYSGCECLDCLPSVHGIAVYKMVVSPVLLVKLNPTTNSPPEPSPPKAYRKWHPKESDLHLFVHAPTPTPKTSPLRHMIHRRR